MSDDIRCQQHLFDYWLSMTINESDVLEVGVMQTFIEHTPPSPDVGDTVEGPGVAIHTGET